MLSGLESIENRELTANPSWANIANQLVWEEQCDKFKRFIQIRNDPSSNLTGCSTGIMQSTLLRGSW